LPILLLLIPVFSTLSGGLVAIRFRRSLTLLIAAGAGLLLGAAFLDLLPEAISLQSDIKGDIADVLGIVLLSFLLFLALQHVLDAVAARWEASTQALGKIGGLLLIFHSLRDGMAIGLSYAASHPAGYAVAAGIAAHDLGDGMNTVILTTGRGKPRAVDYLFLLADSLAPVVGGLLTIWWTFSARSSAILLATAAGFFIQMATSDFLPEVRQSEHARRFIIPAVISGAAIIYLANYLTGRMR
jgi:zinc and cadmium transporter